MPLVGERKSQQRGTNYMMDPDYGYAKAVAEAATGIVNESGIDMFERPSRAFSDMDVNDSYRRFFIEGQIDEKDTAMYPTPEALDDAYSMLEEQYENDREAIQEYANIGSFNPIIGLTPYIHKLLLMNTLFDKGVIPKFVARSPKFTFSMEYRIMRNAVGDEIDMWLEQNKIFDMMESTAPFKDTILKLPETMTTDVLGTTFAANAMDDNLSIESNISAVLIQTWMKAGEVAVDANGVNPAPLAADGLGYKWYAVPPKFFHPNYGEYDRTMMESVAVTVRTGETTTKLVDGMFTGYVKKNRFFIQCSNPDVVAIKLTTRIDTSSAMLRTCNVDWKVVTDIVEIPNAIPINTPVSPEEVKDIAALYNVNQLTKIMAMFKLILSNYKDEKIRRFLDKSFMNLPAANKFVGGFDMDPKKYYFSTPVDWRREMFIDQLETFITPMIQVLNDPNMTISVIGRSDLIRKLTPTANVSYTSQDSAAGIQMDFHKTVVTPDKRVYQFMSADKMRDNNNLIILLNPRNTDRCIYRLYDYQLFVSNEIRNAANWALPAIHAFERFKCVEYQPVQGRYRIVNPTGLTEYVENNDPVGVNRVNDYTSNIPDKLRDNYVAPDMTQRISKVNPNTFIY